ncbi:MAG: DAK2 domain-containing protein [Tissierellia bacterium]|nr:DAK2 domain-containing protein [Tissierellia bacterium]
MMKAIDGRSLQNAFNIGFQVLDSNKEGINALNVFPVPDGDTGTNMSLTMKSAVKAIGELQDFTVAKVAKAASTGSLMGARGNSGVILSQLLRGFSLGMDKKVSADVEAFHQAMVQASKVAYNAVMKPTEGTMLTVARMMAEYSQQHYAEFEEVPEYLKAVISEGQRVLELTPTMLPALAEAGVVDAGGKGYLAILEGMLMGIQGESFEETASIDNFSSYADHAHPHSESIEFGYCTEFMILAGVEDTNPLREEFSNHGDSVLVVSGEDVTKVHLHTNNPGAILERAMQIGPLTDIKIDNMRQQHQNIQKKPVPEQPALPLQEKEYGFIAVSSGEGIERVFRDLNVDEVIAGGQTMNPSTEDFMEAINRVHAKTIYIFPNNKNIILAAEQAKKLSKKKIEVIKTNSIPQGFSALLAFEEGAAVRTNVKKMKEALDQVKSLQVTYAVRDSEYNGIKISKGDIIGMLDGKIILRGEDVNDTAEGLIDRSIGDTDSLITIFYGADVKEEQANNLLERMEKHHESFDIEMVQGDQPIYYYVISVE